MKLRNALMAAAFLSLLGAIWGYNLNAHFNLLLDYDGKTILTLNQWTFWLAMLPVFTLILWERFRI